MQDSNNRGNGVCVGGRSEDGGTEYIELYVLSA